MTSTSITVICLSVFFIYLKEAISDSIFFFVLNRHFSWIDQNVKITYHEWDLHD